MNLTDTQLNELEALGAALFSIDKVAIVMDLNAEELRKEMKSIASPAYRAYMCGRYKSEMEIRKNVVDLAARGSSAAQTLACKFLDELKIHESE